MEIANDKLSNIIHKVRNIEAFVKLNSDMIINKLNRVIDEMNEEINKNEK